MYTNYQGYGDWDFESEYKGVHTLLSSIRPWWFHRLQEVWFNSMALRRSTVRSILWKRYKPRWFVSQASTLLGLHQPNSTSNFWSKTRDYNASNLKRHHEYLNRLRGTKWCGRLFNIWWTHRLGIIWKNGFEDNGHLLTALHEISGWTTRQLIFS